MRDFDVLCLFWCSLHEEKRGTTHSLAFVILLYPDLIEHQMWRHFGALHVVHLLFVCFFFLGGGGGGREKGGIH